MQRVLVDANALLSLLTDRNLEQQARVVQLFGEAARGTVEIVLHQHVVSETVFTLRNVYKVPAERVSAIIRDLVNDPGIAVVNELNWKELVEIWPLRFSDYGDAILATAAKREKLSILTFDRSFQRSLKTFGISLAT